jgi:predicted Zn-dependent peptidase
MNLTGMHQKSSLPNGLRILTSPMPYTRSVCLGIFIGAGSRYESEEEAGASHFLEHLCFKGTHRRASSKEISETIEGVGGILNGGTDKELTAYWCKVARPHFSLALDVLADMLRHSKFAPKDIERERRVIIEEINTSWDSPQHRVDLLIDELLFADHPLGRDVAGNKERVSALTRENLLDYFARQYLPNNTVVSVAGDISQEEVVSSLAEAFADWTEGALPSWSPAVDEQRAPRVRLEPRSTEQAHLCLGIRGLSAKHPDRFALDLLNVILGEGMSSRLFISVRERRGLAYDIHSYVSHFLDSGSIIIYAGVAPHCLEEAVKAILEELAGLKDGIPEAEMVKAKELCKGRLLLRMEDTRSVASWAGGQELLLGQVLSVDEVVALIDAIQPADLQRVARQLLVGEKLCLAVVGPGGEEHRLESLLQL